MVRRTPPPEVAALADRLVSRDELISALGAADAVLLGVPLTPKTHRQ